MASSWTLARPDSDALAATTGRPLETSKRVIVAGLMPRSQASSVAGLAGLAASPAQYPRPEPADGVKAATAPVVSFTEATRTESARQFPVVVQSFPPAFTRK